MKSREILNSVKKTIPSYEERFPLASALRTKQIQITSPWIEKPYKAIKTKVINFIISPLNDEDISNCISICKQQNGDKWKVLLRVLAGIQNDKIYEPTFLNNFVKLSNYSLEIIDNKQLQEKDNIFYFGVIKKLAEKWSQRSPSEWKELKTNIALQSLKKVTSHRKNPVWDAIHLLNRLSNMTTYKNLLHVELLIRAISSLDLAKTMELYLQSLKNSESGKIIKVEQIILTVLKEDKTDLGRKIISLANSPQIKEKPNDLENILNLISNHFSLAADKDKELFAHLKIHLEQLRNIEKSIPEDEEEAYKTLESIVFNYYQKPITRMQVSACYAFCKSYKKARWGILSDFFYLIIKNKDEDFSIDALKRFIAVSHTNALNLLHKDDFQNAQPALCFALLSTLETTLKQVNIDWQGLKNKLALIYVNQNSTLTKEEIVQDINKNLKLLNARAKINYYSAPEKNQIALLTRALVNIDLKLALETCNSYRIVNRIIAKAISSVVKEKNSACMAIPLMSSPKALEQSTGPRNESLPQSSIIPTTSPQATRPTSMRWRNSPYNYARFFYSPTPLEPGTGFRNESMLASPIIPTTSLPATRPNTSMHWRNSPYTSNPRFFFAPPLLNTSTEARATPVNPIFQGYDKEPLRLDSVQ